MNIYPQDLGPNACAQVRQWRLAMVESAFGTLLQMADAQRDKEMMRSMLTPSLRDLSWKMLPGTYTLAFIGACLTFSLAIPFSGFDSLTTPLAWGAIGGFGSGGIGYWLRQRKKRSMLGRALEAHEITIISRKSDELAREYFQVVQTLMQISRPQEAQEEVNLRQALHHLGKTMESLPPLPPMDIMADLATLQAKAEGLTAQSHREEDGVIAASLQRQAEALARRAQMIRRMVTLVRRHQTLRDEITIQVKAFQTNLMAAQIHGSVTSTDFSDLAASIAQVAQETLALADARAELEATAPVLNDREDTQTLSTGT